MIFTDTREKENKHIIDYFDLQNIEHESKALPFGDYISDDETIKYVIERKASISEFAGNCGKKHVQFKRELEKSKNAGYKMIILIEEPYKYEKLQTWMPTKYKSGYRRKKDGTVVPVRSITGETIWKVCNSWKEQYGCKIMFCKKKMAGEVIKNILTR